MNFFKLISKMCIITEIFTPKIDCQVGTLLWGFEPRDTQLLD